MDSALRRIRIAVSTGRLRGLPAEPGTSEITLLGAGESYVAWRIGSGDQARVLRVPRRSPHEMPRSMTAEFETLRRVPPELGTSAIALETGTDNPLGIPYMVTTHVSGRALRATDWNPRLATALAHQIARLHEALATSPAPSAVFVPSAGEQGEELLTWWGRHHPETLTDPRVSALLPAWCRELTRLAPAFEAVPIHPLIHGDVVVTNVILSPDGVPRLIDFEWSGPGDRAKDLALIGGRVIGGPWYLPMTPDDVAAFVTEYSRYSRHAGAIDPQQLLARRDAYELLDRMGNLLYCLSRPGEARYGMWADEIARNLTDRLAD
ncbi:phosphotransferase family protein [Actinomyces naeslundii]|uniref:Phosphotransferase enzyme family protein n=2 Tax=Actinomyces naeslundii TaxID=1655 RepID=J3F541_ACTNH|nr:phosphotransferase [Actinomyces naeslundii]EJN86072.1 phosphotransferase enzyme family protein [Actinomyces naeslundii str. Howell 279]OMG34561.1 phosphotransferase [Actinomyces naeslundii]OMG38150.1 phosphotransferase [Actinomyces naeslundii]OMG40190.1 phosphotransferase [Actinomyces naeslundii]QQC21491.1 phosphotransferase [Actinomyces naeslundii]